MNDQDRTEMTAGNTITVSDISKKWSPMTYEMTGRTAEVCAWTMEEESKYLRTDGRSSAAGRALRYSFPVIRRTIETLAASGPLDDELSPGVVCEITVESFGVVHEAANEIEPDNGLDAFVKDLRDNEMVTDLAARIHASIVSFPG